LKLGGYTFPWKPDEFGIPHPDLFKSLVRTWDTAVYFSWGEEILGKKVPLSWVFMTAAQFDALDAMYQAGAQVVWDPEVAGVGPFNVEIVELDGELFETAHYEQTYRRNVEMILMIADSIQEEVMS
jgi:hypothetical protein